jgi:hypothetical protein
VTIAASLWGLLFLLFGGTTAPPKPVALVYALQGEATLTSPAGARQALHLFDRLPARAVVRVGPGSRLALAFANGRRYELGARSRATVGPQDLTVRSGPVRSLPAVPPLPRLPPIDEADQPGLRAAAVRIRAERIRGLLPRDGIASLAESTRLTFAACEGAGRYQVEVQDPQGRTVFRAETGETEVRVPAGTLQPGARYHWTVRTLDRIGPVARGEADLVTLPAKAARTRETLRAALTTEGGGEPLALLAEIDRSLGLLLEARQELRAALGAAPGDPGLQEALADLERRLKEDGNAE